MKEKTKASIFVSVTSVLFVGVSLLRKLWRRWLPRVPYINHAVEREHYINSILHGSDTHYVSQIRMNPIAFHQLRDILTEGEHIQLTVHTFVREQVLIFLHIIGYNVRFCIIGSQFHILNETVYRCFKVVFRGALKLYKVLIRLLSENTNVERGIYHFHKRILGKKNNRALHWSKCGEDHLKVLFETKE